MNGYGKFDEGLEEKTIDSKKVFFKTFSFTMTEKEMFAAEIIDNNHPHHDWLFAHKGNGIAANIFMFCRKCKCLFDISDTSDW